MTTTTAPTAAERLFLVDRGVVAGVSVAVGELADEGGRCLAVRSAR